MIPLENYYHRASKMLTNIRASGRYRAKCLGVKHTQSHVKVTVTELAEKLQNLDRLICCLCDTPIKIWVTGGASCISCDRHLDPAAPYIIENIRFTHHRCNIQDGSWKHSNEKTIKDFRDSLTYAGVEWVPSNSVQAVEIFEKNREYFRSNKTQQIKSETKHMKHTNQNVILEKIIIAGVQYELESHRVKWFLSKLINSPNYSVVEDDAGDKASVSEVCKWIKKLPLETDITADLLRKQFKDRLDLVVSQKILYYITTTKKGRKLISRESKGIYRRVPPATMPAETK
jgi:hypothetical protein